MSKTQTKTKQILVVEDDADHRTILKELFEVHFVDITPVFIWTKDDIINTLFLSSGLKSYTGVLTDVNLKGINQVKIREAYAQDGIDFIKGLYEQKSADEMNGYHVAVYSAMQNFQKVAQSRLGDAVSKEVQILGKGDLSTEILGTYNYFYPYVSKITKQRHYVNYEINASAFDSYTLPEALLTIREMFPEKIFIKDAILKEATTDFTSYYFYMGNSQIEMNRRIRIDDDIDGGEISVKIFNQLASQVFIEKTIYKLCTYDEIISSLEQINKGSQFNRTLIYYLAQRNLVELYLNKEVDLDEVDTAVSFCGELRFLFPLILIKIMVRQNIESLHGHLSQMEQKTNLCKPVEFYRGILHKPGEEYSLVSLTPTLNKDQPPLKPELDTAWLKENCISGKGATFNYFVYETGISTSTLIELSKYEESHNIIA